MKRRRDGSAARSSKWRLTTAFTSLALSAQPVNARPTVFAGNATQFDVHNISTAGCGLLSWPTLASTHYASLLSSGDETFGNSTARARAASACGRCARVWCVDEQRCGRASESSTNRSEVVVYVVQDDRREWNATVDQDLNLSPFVFQNLTGSSSGRVPVRWRFSECPAFNTVTSNEEPGAVVPCSICLQRGSNPYWLSLQPVNDTLGIAVVTVDNRMATRPPSSTSYFFTSADWRSRYNLTKMEISVMTRSRRKFKRVASLRPGSCFDLKPSDEVARSASGGEGGAWGGGNAPNPGGTHDSPNASPSPFDSSDDISPDAMDSEPDEDGGFDDALTPWADPMDDDDSSNEAFVGVTTAPPSEVDPTIASATRNSGSPSPSMASSPNSHSSSSRTVVPPSSPSATSFLPGLSPSSGLWTSTPTPPHQPSPPASLAPAATQTLTPRPSSVDKGSGRPTEDPADSSPARPPPRHPATAPPQPSTRTPIPTIGATPVVQLSGGVLTSPVFIGVLLGTVGLVGAVVAYRARATQHQRLALAAPATSRAAYARGSGDLGAL